MTPPETPAAFLRTYAALWMARDAAALAALWLPDGRLVDGGGAVADGTAEIEAWYTSAFATACRRARLVTGRTWERPVAPGVMLAQQRFVVTGRVTPTGEDIPRHAMLCGFVLAQQDAGWLVHVLQTTDSHG